MAAVEMLEAVCVAYNTADLVKTGWRFVRDAGKLASGFSAISKDLGVVLRFKAAPIAPNKESGKLIAAGAKAVKFEDFARRMAREGMSEESIRKLFNADGATRDVVTARLQRVGEEAVRKEGKNINKLVAVPGMGALLKCASLILDAGKALAR